MKIEFFLCKLKTFKTHKKNLLLRLKNIKKQISFLGVFFLNLTNTFLLFTATGKLKIGFKRNWL